jgi:hypothetical protein
MKKIILFISIASLFVLASCDKTIYPELDQAYELVVIDAWITDKDEPQNIFISLTQPYFENEFPEKLDGATVSIIDEDGIVYPFVENDSAYTWVSPDGTTFGEVGKTYYLSVEANGQQFGGITQMGRVPVIDSLVFTFDEAIPNFIFEDFYLAQFYATDPVGIGDAYWIKTWKNGTYLNKPSEVNIAFDAGNISAAVIDGVPFIQPVRQDLLNPFDTNYDDERPGFPSPYHVGDSIYVEIHSISPEAYFFLTEVIRQTNRAGGFGALFAEPVANVSSNIFNLDENSDDRAVGFFNISSVSNLGTTLTSEIASEARQRFEEGL